MKTASLRINDPTDCAGLLPEAGLLKTAIHTSNLNPIVHPESAPPQKIDRSGLPDAPASGVDVKNNRPLKQLNQLLEETLTDRELKDAADSITR